MEKEMVREMMEDRGCGAWEESQSNPDIYLAGTILVFFSKHEKFNIETVKQVVYELQEHKKKHALIVYQNIITSSAKKAIEHLQEYTLETFEKKELQFNPTKHRLYCPHQRLDKNQIPVKIKNELQSLPILLRTDIISRYFRFQRGDVIKIQRKNGSIAYRLVK